MNPFLAAERRSRNLRDRFRRQKLFYLTLSGILGIALTVAVGANLWLSTTSGVDPIYIPVNETTGEVYTPRSAERAQTLSSPLVRSRIKRVIRGLRVVYADYRATEQGYEEAWNHILPDSEAEIFLRQTMNLNAEEPDSPPLLVGDLQRTITEITVTPIEGTRSFDLRWIERQFSSRSGQVVERAFTGSISTMRVDQDDREAIQENPLGLYIDGLTWQQTSQEIIQSTSETGSASSEATQAGPGVQRQGRVPQGQSRVPSPDTTNARVAPQRPQRSPTPSRSQSAPDTTAP